MDIFLQKLIMINTLRRDSILEAVAKMYCTLLFPLSTVPPTFSVENLLYILKKVHSRVIHLIHFTSASNLKSYLSHCALRSFSATWTMATWTTCRWLILYQSCSETSSASRIQLHSSDWR